MTNPADTPEVEVDQAVNGVVWSIQDLTQLTRRWPHLVQEQLDDIENVHGLLDSIIAALMAQQEAQEQADEPVNLLGAG
ncbi:hypothetical protein LCGC14_3139790 [marine sediment metagenome]|uniref:Uncharacterized protein n=1 Tax=marine sediment metagenome TaxID=412755 RepID=A0A0F8VXC2_9ZZZZ